MILEPLEPPAVHMCLREPAGGFEAGRQDVAIDDVPRYVGDLEDLARCIRGEATFSYPKDHDFSVQQTLLRACGVDA
jgi:hypothetical protein